MQRKVWIDYAKAIGITTVVMGHSVYTNPHIVPIIFLFHMPLFFFISGYLYNAKKPIKAINKSNITTLLIPYAIFNVFLLCVNVLQGEARIALGLDMNWQENVITPGINFLLGKGGNLPVGASWFLLALIWCKYIVWVVVNGRKWHSLFLTVGVVVILLAKKNIEVAFPYCIDAACAGIWPFAVGYWFRQKGEGLIKIKHWQYVLCLFGGFAMMLVCYHYGANVNYLGVKFGGVLGISATIGGITVVYSIGKLLEKHPNSYIERVSRASILIMCLHMLVSRDVNHLFHYNEHLWLTLTGDLCNVALLTAIFPLVQKYCPIIIGNRK